MNKDPEKDIIMKLSAILPPPASSVGPIHCAGCGAKNPAQKKYCGKCGTHLWAPCINCGESNPANGEFCGNCGANLKEALADKTAGLKHNLSRARKLIKHCEYQEAVGILKPIAAVVHSRLIPAANRAKELLEQCSREQITWTADVRKIEEEIRQFVSNGKVEQAARRLNDVPKLFRSQEICDLLENAQNTQAEIISLSKEIARLEDRSLTADLVDKVERLLCLQPDHEVGLKQALAINRGAMRKSKRLALNGEYEKALEILDQVPKVFLDDEFRGFREQISDLAYYAWDIEHAPFVDKILLEFARRLCKFLPEDSKYKELCKKLASLEKDFHSILPGSQRWADCPSTPLLGTPMDFHIDLEPIQIGQNANTKALAENPGRFAVACGLALQGLGLAPIKINLLPEQSWIGKIGRWLPKRRVQSAWGIEIGSSGIKAVKLKLEHDNNKGKRNIKQKTVLLQECSIIEHRRRLNQSANDKDRNAMLDETLQNFLKQNPLGDEPVILRLPDWMVLLKIIELPPMPTAKREAAILFQSQRLFSTPLPDVVWKHVCFDTVDNSECQKRPFTVAYVGVRQMMLKEFLTRWNKLGLKIDGVQCDMAALYNFATFQCAKDQNNCPTALVDLGSDRLNILVCSPRRIWHRSIMFGSDRINKVLVRELKLTNAHAERWKCDPTLAPSPGKYSETLQSVYEDYVQETLDSLSAFQKAFPDEKVGRIIGCGGGFLAHDLPRYFLWRR
jgi:Tfp pilus assembly PilM family ATPase